MTVLIILLLFFFLTVHALEDSPRRDDTPAICGNDPKVAMAQKQGLTDTRVLKRDLGRKTNTWPSQRHLLDVPACVAFNTDGKRWNKNGGKILAEKRRRLKGTYVKCMKTSGC